MSYSSARAALQHYSNVNAHSSVESASPHRLIQMLLEGALEKVSIAKSHLMRGAVAEKAQHITWAISIVDGLRISLDIEAGGELARNLDDLYEYISRRLIEANAGNDVTILDEVISLLREVKLGWEEIPAEFHNQTAQPNP